MGSAVGLLRDFSATDLRALARQSGDAAQVRRLSALAAIYAGGTRRIADLVAWLQGTLAVTVSPQTPSLEVARTGLSEGVGADPASCPGCGGDC